MDWFFTIATQFLYSVIAGLGLGYFTYCWNETHFVTEYGNLLGLGGLLLTKEFEQFKKETVCEKYPVFLRERHNSFWTRLLGCPFCLIGFLSLLISCVIAWWSSGVIASVAAIDFLILRLIAQIVYK